MNTSTNDPPEVSASTARILLVDLVETPSPSGKEGPAAERLAAFFEAHDREVWLDDVGNVRAPADDSVLFTSHIDTVPGEVPVAVREATEDDPGIAAAGDDVLWGRGSVDATGPLAAMAVAAVATGVSFVGVVGEETDSRGARTLVADRDEPDAVVNGEPSGTTGITLGYRGFLAGTYVATSESGHTSRPEPNAIQHAIEWWSGVESAFENDDEEFQPVFERVTAKPVAVDGGISDDGLSVETTLEFQLRIPPALDAETVRETAEDILHRNARRHQLGRRTRNRDHNRNRMSRRSRAGDEIEVGTVSWAEPIPPVMESPRTPVARAFRAAIRKEGSEPRLLRKTGTSDMNLYAGTWECPMVTYGPGNSELDHAPDERLSLAEYHQSIAILKRVARTLSGDS